MKKKQISILIVLSSLLNMLVVSALPQQPLLMPSMHMFSGYNAAYDCGFLPEGFSVQNESRIRKCGMEWFDDPKYNEAFEVGYFSEPNLAFGKTVKDGKMHIGFDFSVSDKIARAMYVGFYDGRNGDNPFDWNVENYSKSVVLKMGNVSCYRAGNNHDMTSWTSENSEHTYESNEWHRIDLLFDMKQNTANYYFDGKIINSQPIKTNSTAGLKSLFFRVETPGISYITQEEKDKYMKTLDVFYIDNLYVNTYADNDDLYIESVQKNISPNKDKIGVTMSEPADVNETNVVVQEIKTGKIINIDRFEKTMDGFILDLSNLSAGNDYKITLSGVKGKLTNGNCKNQAVFSTNKNYEYLHNEDFEKFTVNNMGDWYSEKPTNLEVCLGKSGNGLKINSATKDFLTKWTFNSQIVSDNFTMEMYIKYSGGFDVGFLDENGNFKKVAGVENSDSIVGCYPDGTGMIKPESGCIMPEHTLKWNKLKISMNKLNKTYTIGTGTGSYTVPYSSVPNKILGVGIVNKKALGTSLCLDSVLIYDGQKPNTIFTFRADSKIDLGANITMSAPKKGDAVVLKCAEEYYNEKNILKYKVTPEIAAINIDVDSDVSEIDINEKIYIKVNYYDYGYGWFFLKYNNGIAEKRTKDICLNNTGKIMEYTFVLEKAKFTNAINGSDIKLCTTTYNNNIDASAGNRNFSKYPVYINSIIGYCDNTYDLIDVECISDFEGNVFYDFDIPQFRVMYYNKDAGDRNLTVKYSVYKYDKSMNILPVAEQNCTYKVMAQAKTEDNIFLPIDNYGVYVLKITVQSNDGKKVYSEKEIPFSKCVKNDKLNCNLGASTHFTKEGNADTGMKMMKNAGLGLVRDDFVWSDYEKKKGEYKLTDKQVGVLNAVRKYGLNFMPIVYGNNSNYDSTNSSFVSEQNLNNFGNYITSLLGEPLFHNNVSMIEIWNEPDIVRTLEGRDIYDNNLLKGATYGKILKTAYNAAKKVDSKYQIGGFSICGIGGNNAKEFTDYVLDSLNGQKCFDTVTMHPYLPGEDAEPGHFGKYSANPKSYIGYLINYYRSLINGSVLKNNITGVDEVVKGLNTKKSYDFKWDQPAWHTEFGYSTANYPMDSLCVGGEYEQAKRLVRGINEIKLNNFNDKVWIYDIADDGLRTNEKEHNFGILHSNENEVPYAAKYAFLAVSNYNKMTEGSTETNSVYSDNYEFVTQYKMPERDIYMLWTTKDNTTLKFDLGNNVIYYDLLGNRIEEQKIKSELGYNLTDEPFYAVVGKDIERTYDKNIDVTFYFTNGFSNVSSMSAENVSKLPFEITAVPKNKNDSLNQIMLCAMYSGNNLISLQQPKQISVGLTYIKYASCTPVENCNKIKLMMWNNLHEMKPICVALEK